MFRFIANSEPRMDIHAIAVILALLVGAPYAVEGGPCFTFSGNGYLRFNLDRFNNSGPAHYSLRFKTNSPHGLIMYSSGDQGDDEALYVRDGMLVYHLFNQSPTGVEGYFGGRYLGTLHVNTNDEVEVDLYRAFSMTDPVQRTTYQQTGMVFKVGGTTQSHLDFRPRSDIRLNNEVLIGGFGGSLSSTVGNFTGQIYDIHEEKNNAVFRTFTLNAGGHVRPGCFEITPA